MNEVLKLSDLGMRLRKIDRHLVALLSQRMNLSLEIELAKRQKGEPICRPTVEDDRLNEVCQWAREKKLNPHFMRALLYLIIDESCKVQLIQLQQPHKPSEEDVSNEDAWYETLRANHRALTDRAVSIYESYDRQFFSTQSYLDYERDLLLSEVLALNDHEIALDIGCATGRTAFWLANHFQRVFGYDISPAMSAKAVETAVAKNLTNVEIKMLDIENGIPHEDETVSLIVMNFGTASDLMNLKCVLCEAERVLKQGGKIFLSFYNSEALVYKWDFIPWPLSIAAEVNVKKHCLDVHADGEVFPIYARPYCISEVDKMFSGRLNPVRLLSYPTISSILPNDLFEDALVRDAIVAIDAKLSDLNMGTYIVAVREKSDSGNDSSEE